MRDLSWVFAVDVVAAAFLLGLLLLMPRIARRGLLFGVYVGEEAAGGDEARRISRRYTIDVLFAAALSVVASLCVLAFAHPAVALAGAPLLLAALGQVAYFRAYFAARPLARREAPAAAATLDVVSVDATHLPWIALAVGVAAGFAVVLYTAFVYPDLPDRVPTHFGPNGSPDRWSPKSFGSVMALPIMTLLMGVVLGGAALLAARAKRAIRHPDGGVSTLAQARFRRAMARFLSGCALLTTALLVSLSIMSVQVALGRTPRIPLAFLLIGAAVFVYACAGSIYLALHYGQGGARLERAAATAPLTDGLADNARWVLGIFYVNRDDPSIFVEHRFGLGYTINLGNPKAVVLLVGFLLAMVAITVIALVAQ